MCRLVRRAAALLTAGLALSSAGGAGAAFPGLNGKIAFASGRSGDNDVWVMSPDGSNVARLTSDPATDIDPAWSADGTSIAFTSNRAAGNDDIYVMDASGGGVTRLTTSPASDVNPAWSPGGRNIAFASTRDGNGEIYVMNADGSQQARLTTDPASDAYPAWSPDGTKIAFHSNRTGNYDIFVMNVDGTGQTQLTTSAGNDISPSWSPDGSRIAFASDRDGNYEIYVMDANGANQTRLTRNTATDLDPAWSPDGNLITFTSRRDGDAEIYSMNANGTGQTRLTTSPFEDTTPDWQPVPEAKGPPAAVQDAAFHGSWRESVYRGSLLVEGTVPGPAKLQLVLRRGSRTYLKQALEVEAAGSFQTSFRLPAGLLPATYVLDVASEGSPTELQPQHVPVTLSPPAEGVVSRAWASTAVLGPPLTRLPAGSSIAWAQFRFAALPKPGRTLVVSWQGPGKTQGPRRKPRADLVVAFLGSTNGPPLPRGTWLAVLRAGGTVVKRLAFRVA